MEKSLAGKKIVLTGTSRGVGLRAARLFLDQGAQVLGVARDSGRLQAVEVELAARGHFHTACVDLKDSDAGEKIAAAATKLFDRVDILVCNAGVMLHHDATITAEPKGVLEESLQINLLAPFRVSRALLPLLEKSSEPRILHVSSGAGTLDGLKEPGIAAYRLSKWALNGFVMLQALELAGKITVNAFDPGWVRTDLGGPKAPGTPEESAQGMLKSLLLPPSVSGKFLKDGEEINW